MERMRRDILYLTLCLIFFFGGVLAGNIAPFYPQSKKQPIIIYKVDNAGAEIDGKITDKEIIEGRYTVTVDSYGRFLVTKTQYESLSVGDEIPEYLRGGGN